MSVPDPAQEQAPASPPVEGELRAEDMAEWQSGHAPPRTGSGMLPIRHDGPDHERATRFVRRVRARSSSIAAAPTATTKVCTGSGSQQMTEPLEALRGYVHFLHEREGVGQVKLIAAAQEGLGEVGGEGSQTNASARPSAGSRRPPGDGSVSRTRHRPTFIAKISSQTTAPSPGGRRLPRRPNGARKAPATSPSPAGFLLRRLFEVSGSTKAEQLRHLAERASVCVKCPHLVARRHTVVFGVGNPEAKLMFVGEAPGEEEDLEGRAVRRPRGTIADQDDHRDGPHARAGLHRQHREVPARHAGRARRAIASRRSRRWRRAYPTCARRSM